MTAKAQILVRRMDFDFAQTPRYWFDNDPFVTQMLNAMSALFPDGERFFVDSVRAVREQIQDPEMQKLISGFIGQEAMHSKEHHTFNDYATEQGIDLAGIEAELKVILTQARKVLSPMQQLAITVALEHFTAIIAAQLLRREDISTLFQGRMYNLWMWHAIEENEHKNVAYDVFEQVGGSYPLRIVTMMVVTVLFIAGVAMWQSRLLWADKKLAMFLPRHWARGLNRAWGLKGFFTGVIPDYFDFYRRGFHPHQHQTDGLLAHWRQQLALAG